MPLVCAIPDQAAARQRLFASVAALPRAAALMPMSESLAPTVNACCGWWPSPFLQSLDATILNTALPAMAQSLGESPMKMQSVIVAYSLTTAMLIPATGWVADRLARGASMAGRSRCLCWARCCARSRPTWAFWWARVVQGVGAP
jgi:MFS family permease